MLDRQRERFGGIKWRSAFFEWLTATGTALILTAIAAAAAAAFGMTTFGSAITPGGARQAAGQASQAAQNPGIAQTAGITGAVVVLVILLIAYSDAAKPATSSYPTPAWLLTLAARPVEKPALKDVDAYRDASCPRGPAETSTCPQGRALLRSQPRMECGVRGAERGFGGCRGTTCGRRQLRASGVTAGVIRSDSRGTDNEVRVLWWPRMSLDEPSVGELQLHGRHRWRFAPVASSVPELRRRLRIVLASVGIVGDDADNTLLVATELATNAVEHARTPFWVSLGIGDPVLIEVAGELDINTAPQLQAYLATTTATHPTHLILDLTKLCFISSHGLTVLLLAHNNHGGVHGELHLVGVMGNPMIERVLQISGLHQVLRIHHDLNELLVELDTR